MDILQELERILADVATTTHLTPPIKRGTVYRAANEIKRLRAINVGPVAQLNGAPVAEEHKE